jgi:hypothetical protein
MRQHRCQSKYCATQLNNDARGGALFFVLLYIVENAMFCSSIGVVARDGLVSVYALEMA